VIANAWKRDITIEDGYVDIYPENFIELHKHFRNVMLNTKYFAFRQQMKAQLLLFTKF